MRYLLLLLSCLAIADPSVKLIKLAEHGYVYAKKNGIAKNPITVIVDFSLPSNKKRLWLYDLDKHKTLLAAFVAHGRATGLNNAKYFSNKPNSKKSSIGFFKVLGKYYGKHGLSLRLQGLEKTNNTALARGIVIHAGSYTDDKFVAKYHHLGRSWGCFVVSKAVENIIIKNTENGSLLLAFYPEKSWLTSSKFIV